MAMCRYPLILTSGWGGDSMRTGTTVVRVGLTGLASHRSVEYSPATLKIFN